MCRRRWRAGHASGRAGLCARPVGGGNDVDHLGPSIEFTWARVARRGPLFTKEEI